MIFVVLKQVLQEMNFRIGLKKVYFISKYDFWALNVIKMAVVCQTWIIFCTLCNENCIVLVFEVLWFIFLKYI